MAKSLGLDRPRGVLISEVFPGGPAAKAGLKKGDVVLSIDGREVFDEKGMKFIAATKAEGETVDMTVISNGRQRLVRTALAPPPGTAKAELIQISGNNPFNGTQMAEVSPAFAEELGLDPFKFENGMMIYSMQPRSFARRVGFQPGDIVREINGVSIRNRREFEAALQRAESGDGAWRLAIERNGERIETTL
jgi:S1-C subfamily serine protease